MFFLDAFFNGICICLDWSFGLCQVKSFLWNCCEVVVGQGLTREAWYMVYSRCYAMMVTMLWFLQDRKNIICGAEPSALRPWTSIQPSQHQLDIVGSSPSKFDGSEHKVGHCIETSNLVMGIDIAIVSKHWIRTSSFLEFRRANRFTETALKLHWMGPKTGPATKSISRLQRLIACYIHTIIYYTLYTYYASLFLDWGNQEKSAVLQSFNGTNLQLPALAEWPWSECSWQGPTCINHHPEAPLVKWDSLPRWDLVSRFVCSSAVQRSGRSAQATYAPLLPSTYLVHANFQHMDDNDGQTSVRCVKIKPDKLIRHI